MKEKRIATRITICTIFVLGYLVATVPSVRSYPPFLNKAKQLGLPAKDCTYCHVNAAGGEPYAERGKWLIAEKAKRSANSVDVVWLKEYPPDAGSGTNVASAAAPAATASASASAAAVTSPASSASAASRSDQSGSSGQHEIMRLNREWADAIIRGDSSASERFVAADGTFTDATGSVHDKAQSVAMIKSGDLKLASTTFDDVKVREYGDTAVVTYRSMDKGTYKGQAIDGQYRWTETWVKRGGTWQQVAGHQSRITQQ